MSRSQSDCNGPGAATVGVPPQRKSGRRCSEQFHNPTDSLGSRLAISTRRASSSPGIESRQSSVAVRRALVQLTSAVDLLHHLQALLLLL